MLEILDHPHIVKLEEAIDEGDKAKSLIFEFVGGQTLHSTLKA